MPCHAVPIPISLEIVNARTVRYAAKRNYAHIHGEQETTVLGEAHNITDQSNCPTDRLTFRQGMLHLIILHTHSHTARTEIVQTVMLYYKYKPSSEHSHWNREILVRLKLNCNN